MDYLWDNDSVRNPTSVPGGHQLGCCMLSCSFACSGMNVLTILCEVQSLILLSVGVLTQVWKCFQPYDQFHYACIPNLSCKLSLLKSNLFEKWASYVWYRACMIFGIRKELTTLRAVEYWASQKLKACHMISLWYHDNEYCFVVNIDSQDGEFPCLLLSNTMQAYHRHGVKEMVCAEPARCDRVIKLRTKGVKVSRLQPDTIRFSKKRQYSTGLKCIRDMLCRPILELVIIGCDWHMGGKVVYWTCLLAYWSPCNKVAVLHAEFLVRVCVYALDWSNDILLCMVCALDCRMSR